MANKRIKKKHQKQKVQQKLIQKGYTEKQVRYIDSSEWRKVSKQIQSNERKQQKRKQNQNYIKKHNLTESYKHNGKVYKGSQLKDLSPETLQKFAEVQKRREKERALQQRKIEKIMQGGYSREFAEKYKNKSLKFVDDVAFKGDRTVYKSSQYLSVTWADVTGDSEWSLALHQFDNMNTNDMIAEIHDIYKNSKGKSGSAGFQGVAKISVSDSGMKNFNKAQKSVEKGYKGAMVTEGKQLLSSNEFTVRGYANMMLSVLSRAKPDHVRQYYNELETFAYTNLPEIHKQIFR